MTQQLGLYKALQTAREIRAVKILGVRRALEDLESSRAAALAGAETLEDLARLQGLHIYQVEKTTKKGYGCAYWHASRRGREVAQYVHGP